MYRIRFVATPVVLGLMMLAGRPVMADPCVPGAADANAITVENCLPGTLPGIWDISGAGDLSIQGFATDISINKGETVHFKIDTDAAAYFIDIYRLGYYQGNGARKVATVSPSASLPQAQPACLTNATTGLVDCGNWAESAHWDVPADAVSGIYFAKLTRAEGGGSSHIAFVVRDDAGNSDLLFQTSDTTWQAYNVYGGNSLYVGSVPGYPSGHAPKVSYNRPFITRNGGGGGGASEDWLFNAEYPMVRFLEANGYDVTYMTGVDTDRRGNLLVNHKVFMSVGHDEYWSGGERTAVEAARDAGVHLAFFSGNEIYWKTRWEPSTDGTDTPYRTLVCYKEGTLGENVCGGKCDPLTNVWTGLWRDGCAFPLADGCRPENALSGQISWDGTTSTLQISDTYKNLRFWRNTAVATLGAGLSLTLTPGTLGYEWDWQQYTDHYPPGRVSLSTTDFDGKSHHLSLYRTSGGALVFGAGTVQWSWGLDRNHDRGSDAASLAMQQATVNLFADMGVQPKSLQTPGLVAATASGDTTPPASTIGFPASGASLPAGSAVAITGTAADAAGVVAGAEVSVDGGATWQAATGTTSWSFPWTPSITGSVTLKSRAFDDLGNLESPGAGPASNVVTVTVTPGSQGSCPCTIFGAEAPSGGAVSDNQPIELGVKFLSNTDGVVTGVRFYKGVENTGTHIGHLWTSAGAQLAEATFTNESSSGWQTVSFASPVAITAGTIYVASYHSEAYFSDDAHYFASAKVNGPLTAISNTDLAGGNGVYIYSASSAFPNNSPAAGAFDAPNYWVDVVFDIPGGPDVTPPTVTATIPGNNAAAVATNSAVTATFSEALDATTVTTATFELRDPSSTLVTASVEYDAPSRTATLTPGTLLATSTIYTARLVGGTAGARIKDVAGNALATDYAWSFTTAAPDSTPPTVTSTVPASGAGGVAPTATVNAVFSEALTPSTVNGTTFELRDALNALVAGAVSYNVYSRTATLTPSSSLAAGAYNARLAGGGTDPRIKDLAGNALAADYVWPFTVSTFNCPCTIWSASTVPGTVADPDTAAIEVGVKFRASVDGYVTGVRFYKGATNTGAHIGNLWSGTGTRLASATFTGETASGWQEVTFGSPVAITADTTYVASYHTPTGHYAQDVSYFLTAAIDSPPLRALRSGEDGPNGLYSYSATSVFPTSEFSASNYWVDVVFATSVGPDVTAPTVVSHLPSSAATAVAIGTTVTATFSEAIDPTTVSGTTFELRDPSTALVSSTVTYDAATRTATLAPTSALAYSTMYTATIKGGTTDPRIKDLANNALVADVTWSFTTAAPPPPPPTDGPGGPILVLSAASNPFSRYPVEILRAEGLNEFFAEDISQVTASELANYDVVILGEMPLSAAQVTMLTDWTNAGGTLVAMRPDAQLAGLLGITPTAGTLANKYLLVNTASGPGVGIVNQTIQFHGTADLYTLSGATAMATLYSDATTATTNPAVTLRGVGANGGQAIAFTYDLARSVVYTRQGNPAWSAEKRDGQIEPIRSDDLYFGNASFDPQPDWVDLNKVAIPQADEQQRLLANAITLGNLHRKPLPRFWYLPKGLKAAIVMSGDDHGDGGMACRFDIYRNQSPANCSVDDWECVRATGYEYTGPGFTDAQAVFYNNLGFEVAVHINTGCARATQSQYEGFVSSQLAAFASTFPSIPIPSTNRNHCIAWSDWSSVPEVETAHGIRLDTNYYYWPASWIQNRSGMFTGSGIPMRFAKLDGTMIEVYQASTEMPDESGESFPSFCDQLLDRANGPEGYYGVFTTNMHFDSCPHAGSDAVVASAQSRGVPVVSSKQMLTWLDGRNGSSFGGLTWSGNALSFTITAAAGSRNLRAMMPTNAPVGQLTGITLSGSPVTYTTQTIKGISYAFFPAASGSYIAQYLVDTTPPIISGVTATPHDDGTATINWTTNEASDSRVEYGTAQGSLTLNASDAALVTSHGVTLTGLAASTTYYYRVTSKDAAKNSVTEPVVTSDPLTFTTPAPICFRDQTTSDFAGGTTDTGTSVVSIVDGEVTLRPAVDAEFTVLPSTTEWQSFPFATGGTSTVTGGVLTVDGARFNTEPITTTYGPGTSVEYVATFGANRHQYVGFAGGDDSIGGGGMFNAPPWAMFGTGTAGTGVQARVNVTGTLLDFTVPRSLLGTAHKYRVDWKTTTVDFYVDDVLVHSEPATIPGPMRVAVSDLDLGGLGVSVDWIRLTPYAASGSFTSRVYDGGASTSWDQMSWTASVPSGTSLQMFEREGNTPTPDDSWTAYTAIPTSGTLLGGSSRYIQYRADLGTSIPSSTPVLQDVHISCNGSPDVTPPVITSVTATPGSGASAVIGWNTDELATSRVDYGTAPDSLNLSASSASLLSAHVLTLTGLASNATYYYRVTSVDAASNSTTSPNPPAAPLSFLSLATPLITSVAATSAGDGLSANVTWTTDVPATSRVDYGTSAGSLTLNASSGALVTSHGLTLTGLTPATIYYYRVTSVDAYGNSLTSPVPPATASFATQAPPCAVDVTSADFALGTTGGGTYVSETGDGEVILQPSAGEEFSGTTLPSGWTSGTWGAGGAVSVGGGLLTVDGSHASTTATVSPGRSLEFVATFQAANFQNIGLAADGSFNAPWVTIGMGNTTGGVYARRDDGADVLLSTTTLGSPHRYRIDWNAGTFVFWVDGVQVATMTKTVATNMVPIASDFNVGGPALSVDWLRLTPYTASGSYTSRVFDSGGVTTWGAASWTSSLPVGTSLAMFARRGDTPAPDGTWTAFIAIPTSGSSISGAGRYLQYRADLATTDVAVTPELRDVTFQCLSTPDLTPPVITNIVATPAGDGLSATVTWTTDELASSRVDYGTSPGALTLNASDSSLVLSHTVILSGLSRGTTYYFRVTSADTRSNSATSPVPPATASFFTPAPCPSDQTAADFGLGTLDANTAISLIGDGEVILMPTSGTDFSGSSLPGDWQSAAWSGGSTPTVSGGLLTLNGGHAATTANFGPGRSIEFVATFGAEANQHIGFTADFAFNSPWALFSTFNSTTGLYARVNSPGGTTDTLISSSLLGSPHRYRIDWNATSFAFYVDGTLATTISRTISSNMLVHASDLPSGPLTLSIDWLRVTPYAASGSFTSRIFDQGGPANWGIATWSSSTPTGTSLSVLARTGNTATPDGSWSAYQPLANGFSVGANSRYIQYRADLATTDLGWTPELQSFAIACVPGPDVTPPVITNVAAASAANGQSATITWTTDEFSDSRVDYGTNSGALTSSASNASPVKSHSLTLTGLHAGVTYSYRVTSADASMNSATSPNPPASPLSFTTTIPVCAVDQTAADFGAGTTGTNTYVSVTTDGEVILAPTLANEFSGTTLPTGWTSVLWSNGAAGGSTVATGNVSVDGGRLTPTSTTGYTSGRVLEFVATFAAATANQHIGFASGDNTTSSTGMFNNNPASWAMFSTKDGTQLRARMNIANTATDTDLGATYLGASHRYRIEWTSTSVVWLIDGVVVRTATSAPSVAMRPGASDFTAGGSVLKIDWIRLSPYTSPGTFDSRIQDGSASVSWKDITWNTTLPALTSASISVRTGNTPTPDGTWTAFAPVASSGDQVGQVGRYLQYRATLSTTDPGQTPALLDLSVRCGAAPECSVNANCDDGNSCTTDTCDSGFCSHVTQANGTACNDGNACTIADTCQAGVCTAGTPVVCTALDQCHVAGACDSGTGTCSNPAKPNGSSCNDGDACTQTDTCQAGVCTGTNPMSCDDADACTADSCAGGQCQHIAICSVSGNVFYYRDNTLNDGAGGEPSSKGVPNVGIGATSAGPALATTADTGAYLVAGLHGNVTLTPVNKYGNPRAADHHDAITAMDAARLAMAAVGNGTLSANQFLAGDVTGNHAISALDASLVARFAAQLIDHFPVATTAGSDWQFLRCATYGPPNDPGCGPPVYDFNPMVLPETGADLYAILYGDVTGNWPQVEALAAAKAGGASSATKPSGQLTASSTVLSMPDTASGGLGATVLVPISATPGDGILGIDMTIQYDPAVVLATNVTPSGIAVAAGFAVVPNLNTPGIVIISTYGTSPMSGSGEIARIEFHVVGAPSATSALTFTRASINEGAITHVLDNGLFTVTCAGAPNGTACNDANACTLGDHCSSGVCTGTAVTAPGEVAGMSFLDDKATVVWDPSADTGAVYDVVRGLLSQLPVGPGGGDEFCAVNHSSTTTLTDTDPIAPGDGFWYLVRAANSCAQGTYGNDEPNVGPPSARVTNTCQ